MEFLQLTMLLYPLPAGMVASHALDTTRKTYFTVQRKIFLIY